MAEAKNSWTIKGIKYNRSGTPDEGQDISIQEEETELGSGRTDKGIYGRPIDASLSIHLMGDLLERLKQAKINVEELLSQDRRQNIDKLSTKEGWLEELVYASFGITFDKNIILKILSQPKCEGMRYYLCINHKAEQTTEEKKELLSLVLVGVDKEGNDLLYEDSKLGENGTVDTTSMIAEYGHPPPPPSPTNPAQGFKQTLFHDKRYALLRLAKQLNDQSKP